MTLRKRLWAGLVATLVVAASFVALNGVPAQADPPVLNCMWQLTTCGYPTVGGTTGPRSGHTLTLCTQLTTPACDANGNLASSANNQAIADMEINGCVTITHTGVTLSDVYIHGNCFYYLEVQGTGSATVSYANVECNGAGEGMGNNDGTTLTVDHSYIHRCADGFNIVENFSLTDSIAEAFETDTNAHGDIGQHWAGDGNITYHHNLLIAYNPMTSALGFPNGVSNVTITDNFLGGGGYTLYCPPDGLSTGWTVTGNRFIPKGEDGPTRDTYHMSSNFHYSTGCVDDGITWSGNFNDATGDAIAAY